MTRAEAWQTILPFRMGTLGLYICLAQSTLAALVGQFATWFDLKISLRSEMDGYPMVAWSSQVVFALVIWCGVKSSVLSLMVLMSAVLQFLGS